MRPALFFLPDQFLVLVIVGLGLALILNLAKPNWVFGTIGWLLVLAILSPFIESFVSGLSLWILLPVLLVLSVLFLRMMMETLIGKEGTSLFMGKLSWSLFKLPFHFIKFLISKMRGSRE